MAISNFPAITLVSWNTELGVAVNLTSRPFWAKNPFSCATKMGQLEPPEKPITLTGLKACAGSAVKADNKTPINIRRTILLPLQILLSDSIELFPLQQASHSSEIQDLMIEQMPVDLITGNSDSIVAVRGKTVE